MQARHEDRFIDERGVCRGDRLPKATYGELRRTDERTLLGHSSTSIVAAARGRPRMALVSPRLLPQLSALRFTQAI
jgi:hypothetical protein